MISLQVLMQNEFNLLILSSHNSHLGHQDPGGDFSFPQQAALGKTADRNHPEIPATEAAAELEVTKAETDVCSGGKR